MLQDKKVMFATDLAYGGTPEVIDLKNANSGPGRRYKIAVNGNGLAGITGFKLVDGATSSPATDVVEWDFTSAELNAGVVVDAPQIINRYVTIALVGTGTAGTYNAGIVLEEGQTNM